MAPAVQAGSLANVMALADNPPAQLHQHERVVPYVQQPLVLYIARVPGSRDVFLTTMKPQQKVVTAQDVQSSLYYLHVDSPRDHELLREEGSDEDGAETCPDLPLEMGDTAGFGRKPSLQNLNSISNDRLSNRPLAELHLETRTHGSDHNARIARTPVGQSNKNGHHSPNREPKLPTRRPLGPRPIDQGLQPVPISALQSVPGGRNINLRRWSEQPPALPPRQISIDRRDVNRESLEGDTRDNIDMQRHKMGTQPLAEHGWSWERSWEARRASEARKEMADITSSWQNGQEESEDVEGSFRADSLSLIRRYNGEQWNVAKMVNKSNECRTDLPPHTRAGISVDILTLGYSKFVDVMDPDGNLRQGNQKKPPTNLDEAHREPFRRHLQLSKTAGRPNHKHKFTSSESSLSFERRQHSFDSFRTSTIEPSEQNIVSPKGHFIQSPWNGVCEFSTGIAGRSLKCKHSYPSSNPSFGPGIISAPVSELRFNLPSSSALGTPPAKSSDVATSREGKRSSLFLRPHHRRTSSREMDGIQQNATLRPKVELEDRLDLSLGQEHAGGGFGGKHAKLGKLIVEAEGMQMLDLVVATNLALWWRVYGQIT